MGLSGRETQGVGEGEGEEYRAWKVVREVGCLQIRYLTMEISVFLYRN